MEVETETQTQTSSSSSSSSSSSRGDHHLVAALEQASAMAKRLPSTTDPSQLLQIRAALQSAHHHLSRFLSNNQHPPSPPPPPPPPPQPENSVSSAAGDGEPMQIGDDDNDDGDEHNSMVATCTTVDKVEERMRECFIRNKRPLSPSAAEAAEEQRQRTYENAGLRDMAAAAELFDPFGTGSRTLDLIYQFHS